MSREKRKLIGLNLASLSINAVHFAYAGAAGRLGPPEWLAALSSAFAIWALRILRGKR